LAGFQVIIIGRFWVITEGNDPLFEEAYKDPRRKHKIEIAISKVRADLRKRGLLAPR
jgi:hypothetical protein